MKSSQKQKKEQHNIKKSKSTPTVERICPRTFHDALKNTKGSEILKSENQ